MTGRFARVWAGTREPSFLFEGFLSIRAKFDADPRGYDVVVGIHAMSSDGNATAKVVGSGVHFIIQIYSPVFKTNNHIRVDQMLNATARDTAEEPLLVKDGAS